MKVFNFESLKDHDLYHQRYGKGALIIATPKENVEKNEQAWQDLVNQTKQDIEDKQTPYGQRIKELTEKQRKLHHGDSATKQEREQEIKRLQNEIDALRQEFRELNELIRPKQEMIRKRFFSHLQIAMFYSHNISSQSDVFTRFDKIINIEETESYVTVTLKFTDTLNERHNYHSRIDHLSKMNISERKKTSREIEGMVKRVIPIDSVTLEIVERINYADKI